MIIILYIYVVAVTEDNVHEWNKNVFLIKVSFKNIFRI